MSQYLGGVAHLAARLKRLTSHQPVRDNIGRRRIGSTDVSYLIKRK
jgi:hypothetical protein